MFVILLIAVLLFGANKIPKLARSTGQAMGEFQKGRQQVEQELEEMEESMDPEADVASNDSTVDLEEETPDDEFEVDEETQSST
jgi:sec-independent protein translocase protein TatA